MTTIAEAAVAQPLEFLTIGGQQYRVGKLDDNQMITCHRLCVGQTAAGPSADITVTTAILAHALITQHHPLVTIRELIDCVGPEHPPVVAREMTRQMLAVKGFLATGVH
jgi:hypothetical protein